MKCSAMAGELRLGESARILKNTRELLFSRTLSCSAPPPLPALSISFFLSHFLIDCFKFLGPLLANWTHALHYVTLSKLILSEGKNLIVYMVFQNLVLFPDFPLGIQGSCLERPNILTSPINLLTLTVTDGTIMFNLQVMHSLILTQSRSIPLFVKNVATTASCPIWGFWPHCCPTWSGGNYSGIPCCHPAEPLLQNRSYNRVLIHCPRNESFPFFCIVIQN